jgi:predicted metalloprotease with PDZ domain
MIKKSVSLLALLLLSLSSCHRLAFSPPSVQPDHLRYHLELLPTAADHFDVMVELPELKAEETVFQFCATAPGTYQTMDIGRLVSGLIYQTPAGREERSRSTEGNAFALPEEGVLQLRYRVLETWDTELKENPIYRMAGTSVEADHAFICPHAVFGFLPGRQSEPLELVLTVPRAWQVGTALKLLAEENLDVDRKRLTFYAENFDDFVDSPILAGALDRAEMDLAGCRFETFTYRPSGKAGAQAILEELRDELLALRDFAKGFPIERYTLLFHFEDRTVGAWEHTTSSTYVFRDADFETLLPQKIPHFVSHETFHMITPLHIRSEAIYPYNFAAPQPTAHIWFFEGVTEWAAKTMLLRAGLSSLEDYLKEMRNKLFVSRFMAQNTSLTDMSLQSFTPKGQAVFGNFYMKGALNAMLLDILLLQHSGGQSGLRELVLQLKERFGPERVFAEAEFIPLLTSLSGSPAIGTYFERHVQGIEPLPFKEVLALVGIEVDDQFQFHILEEPEPAAAALREAWLRNL